MKTSKKAKILTAPDPEKNHLTPLDSAARRSKAELQGEIAREAYLLWEQGGRLHGFDQEHWFAAEKKLHGQGNPAYPTLEEREELVKSAKGDPTPVKRIPADDLAKPH